MGRLKGEGRYTGEDIHFLEELMYKPFINARINVDAEIAAMAAYLATRWAGITELEPFFRSVYAVTVQAAPLWFNGSLVYDISKDRTSRREALLASLPVAPGAETLKLARYDAPFQLWAFLPLEMTLVERCAMNVHGVWDYERSTKRAYSAIVAKFPELATARPVGWDEMRKGYSGHDDLYDYATKRQLADQGAFEGIDSGGAGAGGFTIRTALPHVMYDEVEQNCRAPYALVAAAFSHFLSVISHNNTVALKAALVSADLGESTPELLFDLHIKPTGNPLADLMLEMAALQRDPGELRESYERALVTAQERAGLSPEERAQIQASIAARMVETLKSLKAAPPIDAGRTEMSREARCLSRLREFANLPAAA